MFLGPYFIMSTMQAGTTPILKGPIRYQGAPSGTPTLDPHGVCVSPPDIQQFLLFFPSFCVSPPDIKQSFLNLSTFQVISSTSDKAFPNQKLYRMHGNGIVHQTTNVHASDDDRPFFISDPTHLVKTLRNNLENSR